MAPLQPAKMALFQKRGQHLRSDGSDRDLSAGGDEIEKGDFSRNLKAASLDQVERFVNLRCFRSCLSFGDFADGEVVTLSAETERAVVGISFFDDSSHSGPLSILCDENALKSP